MRAIVQRVGVGRTVGSIRITEKLASGERGEHFLGEQPGLRRKVELYRLRADIAENEVVAGRFDRAGEFGGQIFHPNTVFVLDSFVAYGDRYLVTEHVDGPTLAELAVHAPLPALNVARIGIALAEALRELHGRGMVHGHVTGSAVQLSRWGEVKLGDFSAAQWIRDGGEPAADVAGLGRLLATLAGTPGPSRVLPARGLARQIQQATAAEPVRRPSAAALSVGLASLIPTPAPDPRDELTAMLFELRSGRLPVDKPDVVETPPVRVAHGRARVAAVLAVCAALATTGGVGLVARNAEVRDTAGGKGARVDPSRPAPARVRFAANPWAEVSLDGGEAFLTPRASYFDLTAGEHRVRFAHPDLGTVEKVFYVRSGETRTLVHTFRSRP